MNGIFRLTKTAPSTVRVHSRESCTYLSRIMKYIGWLPPKQGKKRSIYLFWATLAFIYSVIYAPVGFLLSLVIDFKNFTPGEFLDVCQVTFNVMGSAAKTVIQLVFMSHLHQMKLILDQMDKQLLTQEDFRDIHKSVARCNKIIVIYVTVYVAFSISVIMAGAIGGHPPWMIYNPLFNWRDGMVYFWAQSILESICGVLIGVNLLIADTNPLVSIIIFRAHVDVLKTHIRILRTDTLKTESENYADLIECINYHKLILKYSQLMGPVMSQVIFVHYLLIGVILGLTLINVMYFSSIFKGFVSITYFFIILMETFPFCYLCDLLAKDCEDLSNIVGQSHWINAEPKYKTTLRIFMHHVQQPITFNAGGIIPITVSSNVKVAKFAFSVMTIVQQMNLADRLN